MLNIDQLQINNDFMPVDLRGGVGTTKNNANKGVKTDMFKDANGVMGVEGMQKLNEMIQRKA